MEVVRTEEQIAAVESAAFTQTTEGGSRYPGATYEQGVVDTLEWLRGEDTDVGDLGS